LLVAAALSLVGAVTVYALGRFRRWFMVERGAGARQVGRFALHFVEMAVAMAAGMVALGALSGLVLEPAGFQWLTAAHPETHLLAMAVFMAAPMVAWMRLRGHGWQHGAEMTAAMIVPALLAIAVCAAGLLPRTEMMTFGHTLMWVAMLGVMFLHWSHYAGVKREHHMETAQPATPVAASA
jgi:flagellar biosynthetic protein FliP